jgi:DNA-binding CsgD family transcriptional regulator
MRGRPTRITDAIRQRLNREAEIIAQHTPYKELALELGLTAKYISNYISRTLQSRIKVEKASNKDKSQ